MFVKIYDCLTRPIVVDGREKLRAECILFIDKDKFIDCALFDTGYACYEQRTCFRLIEAFLGCDYFIGNSFLAVNDVGKCECAHLHRSLVTGYSVIYFFDSIPIDYELLIGLVLNQLSFTCMPSPFVTSAKLTTE